DGKTDELDGLMVDGRIKGHFSPWCSLCLRMSGSHANPRPIRILLSPRLRFKWQGIVICNRGLSGWDQETLPADSGGKKWAYWKGRAESANTRAVLAGTGSTGDDRVEHAGQDAPPALHLHPEPVSSRAG